MSERRILSAEQEIKALQIALRKFNEIKGGLSFPLENPTRGQLKMLGVWPTREEIDE